MGDAYFGSGVGGLIGALSATRVEKHFGTTLTARATLAVSAPFELLLPAANPGARLPLFIIGAFVVSFGIAIVGVTYASLRQTLCPEHLPGRVVASARLLLSVTIPVGALIGGAAGKHFGNRTAMLIGAIAYTIAGLLVTVSPVRHTPQLSRPSFPDT